MVMTKSKTPPNSNNQKVPSPNTNVESNLNLPLTTKESILPIPPDNDSALPRVNRVICLPFDQEFYIHDVLSAKRIREIIDFLLDRFPEIFPDSMTDGYLMKDIRTSTKLPDLVIRRIVTGGITYTIRPSFVMPYCAGYAEDVEKGLFLRKFSVPYWGIAKNHGKNAMYWYRRESSLGRFSLVETVINNPVLLPEHFIGDEKHTRLNGSKVYVATTVANECILGCEVAEDAGNDALLAAYGVFKEEAQVVKSDFMPRSVNLDGWRASRNAWVTLFPGICVISCFLHIYIKIRDCSKKKSQEVFNKIATMLWDCYFSTSKAGFSQRIRRLFEWSKANEISEFIRKKIKKLRDERKEFSVAYEHPEAYRTSNMLDRLMQRMDRCLFCMKYFHGKIESARLIIRGWCLIQNFAPSNPYTIKKYAGLKSPAERFNGFAYHDNWLQNLLVSASLATCYRPRSPAPPKPL